MCHSIRTLTIVALTTDPEYKMLHSAATLLLKIQAILYLVHIVDDVLKNIVCKQKLFSQDNHGHKLSSCVPHVREKVH